MKKIKWMVTIVLVFFTNQITAQDMSAVIAAKAIAIQVKLVEWRRHLHQNPELSNQIGRAHV